MRKTFFSTIALAGIASLGFVANVRAQNVLANNDVPGSLLIFPLFDNTRGALTFITVTNTSPTTSIFAHFVYVNANSCNTTNPPIPPPFNCCQEQDRPHFLTPNDTITVSSRIDNPNAAKGYLFVYARQVGQTNPPIPGPNAVKFDHLIGTEWVFEPAGNPTIADMLSINPFVFRAGAAVGAEGSNTDVSPQNGKRDLNGQEYNYAPNVLHFARFWGQFPPPTRQSELVLINLTGGAQFLANADILSYDNDENQSSAQVSFVCWTRQPLSTTGTPNGISAFFDNSFLQATSDSQEYNQSFGIVGGWFNLDGTSANSTQTQLSDPAILGVLLDAFASITPRTAELPFGEGSNTNGRLLSHTLMGD
jgi:hypothetical protein